MFHERLHFWCHKSYSEIEKYFNEILLLLPNYFIDYLTPINSMKLEQTPRVSPNKKKGWESPVDQVNLNSCTNQPSFYGTSSRKTRTLQLMNKYTCITLYVHIYRYIGVCTYVDGCQYVLMIVVSFESSVIFYVRQQNKCVKIYCHWNINLSLVEIYFSIR